MRGFEPFGAGRGEPAEEQAKSFGTNSQIVEYLRVVSVFSLDLTNVTWNIVEQIGRPKKCTTSVSLASHFPNVVK